DDVRAQLPVHRSGGMEARAAARPRGRAQPVRRPRARLRQLVRVPVLIMWRPAKPDEDEAIVAMCLALNAEDPGEPVTADQVRRTLAAFRAEPVRGRAVVAEVGAEVVGYALLVSFWSNEWGGEICAIDELYVAPAHRAQGIGTRLFEAVGGGL